MVIDKKDLIKDLVKAAIASNDQEVSYLKDKGADMEEAAAKIILEFIEEIHSHNVYKRAVHLLINNGANKEKILVLTASKSNELAFKFLNHIGVDMNKALEIALELGFMSAINFLISKGIDKNIALANIASKQDVAAVNLMISKGANKEFALTYAASKCNIASFNFLVSKGANKDKALTIAALKGDIASFNFLVSKGANKNIALAYSAFNNHAAGMDFLIEKGADIQKAISYIEKSKQTIFTQEKRIECINLLTKKAHEKANVALVPLNIENTASSAAEESKEESKSDGGNGPEPDGDFSSVIKVGAKRSHADNPSSSSSSNSNKAAKTDNSVAYESQRANSNSESNSLANQHSNVQQNEQKAGDKESLNSGVLAHSLFSNYHFLYNRFESEEYRAKEALILNASKDKQKIASFNFLVSNGTPKDMALADAALKGNINSFNFLLRNGANKDIALECAAFDNNEAAMNLLIEKGADIQKAIASIGKSKQVLLTTEKKIECINLLTRKAHEKADVVLVPLNIENTASSAAEESKEESKSDGGNGPEPDGDFSSVIKVGAKRSHADNPSSSSSSNSNKASKTDNSVAYESQRASSNSESSSLANQHSDVQQNKQKAGDKESLPNGVLAHSLLKNYLPNNPLGSEEHRDNEDLLQNGSKDKEKIAPKKTLALEHAALNGDVVEMDTLINEEADKEKALARVALKLDKKAVGLLISKGADVNIAFLILASNKLNKEKSKEEALDLLRSQGATNEKALSIIKVTPNRVLSRDKKIEAEKFLTKISNEIESRSDSGDDLESVSESENDQGPDGDSNEVVYVGAKRSRAAIDEDDDDVMILFQSSSSSSSSAYNPNKATKTDGSASARNKIANLIEESNSSENKNGDVQLEIKTKLKDQIVHKSIAEQDLEEAQKTAESILNAEEQALVKPSGEHKVKDVFDAEYLPEKTAEKQVKISENKEISQLYQFGKWVYGLIENAVNSPTSFTDKSGSLGVYSLSYDDGLPKINADSAFFNHIQEEV